MLPKMRRLSRKKALNLVKELDAFPKVPESYVETTASGGTGEFSLPPFISSTRSPKHGLNPGGPVRTVLNENNLSRGMSRTDQACVRTRTETLDYHVKVSFLVLSVSDRLHCHGTAGLL